MQGIICAFWEAVLSLFYSKEILLLICQSYIQPGTHFYINPTSAYNSIFVKLCFALTKMDKDAK